MKKKVIAVNTRFLIKNKLEGLGRFTYETFSRITKQHPDYQFYFFFDRPYDTDFVFSENITPIVLFPPARHPFLWYWWFEISLARQLKKLQPDLFVSPDGYLSLNYTGKSLVVIHDLAFEHYPKSIPYLARHFYQYYTPKYAHHATHIATVSEFSKQDLITRYQIAPQKISVVYNGTNTVYKPLSQEAKKEVQLHYTQNCSYFLFIGAIHPRKNLGNMLRAFDQFKKRTDNKVKFVVAGRKAWYSNKALVAYENMDYQDDVIFLGYVDIKVLHQLLASTLALVYASLFEGFGVPIIEAMYCNVPVITANRTSMPEVAGKGAILVNPESVEEISMAMQKIYAEPVVGKELVKFALEQRQKFTWKKTTNILWETITRKM